MPTLSGKLYTRIANDACHDLAAGTFPALALAAWLIRSVSETDGMAEVIVARAGGSLWVVFMLMLGVSVGTGLLRLRYWKLNVRSGFLETKGQMAAIKHSLFVLVMVASGFMLALAGA